MATVLFIKRSDLVKNSIIDGSVDTDKFIQHIKDAQEIHVRNYLGTDLYNKIATDISNSELEGNYLNLVNDFIQPMLIYWAMTDYLYFAPYTIKNGGVYKHRSETADTPTQEEVTALSNKYRDKAEYYTRRFINYMSFNQTLFPEYNSNTNDDIDPDTDAIFNGWVL